LVAQRRIAQIGEIDLVELEITAPCGGEIRDLLAIDLGEIGVEFIHLGIGFLADRLPTAAEMDVARRRDGDFRHDMANRFQELEMLDKDRVRAVELTHDTKAGRRHLGIAFMRVETQLQAVRDHLDIADLLQEIAMP
jgi:hypothetical protein